MQKGKQKTQLIYTLTNDPMETAIETGTSKCRDYKCMQIKTLALPGMTDEGTKGTTIN